jgi:hypothetical protein
VSDLSDFKRRVYEPETKALRARIAELEAALRGFVEFCETLAAEEGNPIFALYEQARAALAGDGGGAPKDLSHLDSFYLGGPVTPMSRAEHDEYRRWREDYARRTAGDGGGASIHSADPTRVTPEMMRDAGRGGGA